MKPFLIFLLLSFFLNNFAQDKIIIAKDSVNKTIIVLHEKLDFSKIIEIERDIEDFEYLGQIEIANQTYCLFSEYSSPAGLTRYYYYDFVNMKLYVTDFFSEEEFVYFFSLNINALKINFVSGKYNNCGEILSKQINLQMQKKIDSISNLIKFKQISLVDSSN